LSCPSEPKAEKHAAAIPTHKSRDDEDNDKERSNKPSIDWIEDLIGQDLTVVAALLHGNGTSLLDRNVGFQKLHYSTRGSLFTY